MEEREISVKKVLSVFAVLLVCAGFCSCIGTRGVRQTDIPDTVITYDTTHTEPISEADESTETPETPMSEDSVPDTESDTEPEELSVTEPIPEETQIDNILKLPLVDDEIKGYVYLTIDDGPSDKTGTVLDILEEYNVRSTFFFVGNKMKSRSDEVLRAFLLGNDVGCHSMTHDYRSIYQSGHTISDDISKWEAATAAIIGEIPEYRLYRFPGGTTNTVIIDNYAELKSAVVGKGYRSFDWNCANCDKWLVPKPEEQSFEDYLKSSVISTLQTARGPKVMLIHETVKETVDMLPWLIEYIRSQGYEFALLSDFDGEYVFRK